MGKFGWKRRSFVKGILEGGGRAKEGRTHRNLVQGNNLLRRRSKKQKIKMGKKSGRRSAESTNENRNYSKKISPKKWRRNAGRLADLVTVRESQIIKRAQKSTFKGDFRGPTKNKNRMHKCQARRGHRSATRARW